MSIPAILAAGSLVTLEVMGGEGEGLEASAILGLLAAFLSAWAAIAFLMKWLRQESFTPFVIYRLFLGAALLTYAFMSS